VSLRGTSCVLYATFDRLKRHGEKQGLLYLIYLALQKRDAFLTATGAPVSHFPNREVSRIFRNAEKNASAVKSKTLVN